MTDKMWGDLALLIGFGVGLYSFFDGFRIYREYRVLADIPESPIRSLAMGLVQIHGESSGEETLTSPLTHTPCFLYKVDIERWESDRSRGHWLHYWTDIAATAFYIADPTGKVLVDPRGAEYDLIKRRVREIGRTSGLWSLLTRKQTAEGSGASDAELAEYVANLGGLGPGSLSNSSSDNLVKITGISPGNELPVLGAFLDQQSWTLGRNPVRAGRFRFTEYCIVPGELYDVAGTCVENSKPKDEHDRNLICKGTNEPTFLISWRDEREIESSLRSKALVHIVGGAALATVCLYVFIMLAQLGWI